MSKTKRRVRQLKSASSRGALERRAAGARAGKAASAQASQMPKPAEASARAGARFIVIERTARDRREVEPARPFMVVEAATQQIPENFFGRGWIGLHSVRESADAEANELNALAGHFLVGTEPVASPSGAAPVMADLAPVLGARQTAWEREVLTPTQEMPAVTAEDPDPLALPGAATLRAAVDHAARKPAPTRIAQARADAKAEPDAGAAQDQAPVAVRGATRRLTPVDDAARRTTQLPRILDPQNTWTSQGASTPVIPGLRHALIHEIRAGQQVMCTDGAWRTTEGGSLRDGVAVLVMADLTEHAFAPTLWFWVREQPPAPVAAGLRRPPCPRGCFRTQADYRLCTCNWGCGCSPHPPRRAARTDTREFLLAGAVA